jgi:hypothetical protein
MNICAFVCLDPVDAFAKLAAAPGIEGLDHLQDTRVEIVTTSFE